MELLDKLFRFKEACTKAFGPFFNVLEYHENFDQCRGLISVTPFFSGKPRTVFVFIDFKMESFGFEEGPQPTNLQTRTGQD